MADLTESQVATLPDGRRVDVYSLTYGRARLAVAQPSSPIYDDVW